MNTTEDRLRNAYRAVTEIIPPDSIPDLPERATRPQRSKSRSRRAQVLIPLAAAVAVVALAAGIPAVTGAFGHSSTRPRPAASPTTQAVPTAPTGTAYVINSGAGTVTPIDLATNTLGTPIKAGADVGITGMAIAPDGKTAYVVGGPANFSPVGPAVYPIDLVTGTAGKPIYLTQPPDQIVISPDGKTAYTINDFPSRTVTPINLVTNTPGKPVTLNGEPQVIAMTRGGKAYVAIATDGSQSVYEFMSLDLTTYKLGTPVTLSGQAVAIAFAPDGKTAYVLGQSSATVITVTPIDLTTNTARKPIDIRTNPEPNGSIGEPLAIAITPDGTTAYVANAISSTVTPIDLATSTPERPIYLSGKLGAEAIAISANGAAAYVANSGTVTPISLATNTPERPIRIFEGWDTGWEAIATVP